MTRDLRLRRGVLSMAFCVFLAVGAHAAPGEEAETKGLFIYNLAKYVTWPDGSFAADDSPIVVGVVGDPTFSAGLQDLVDGHRAQGRPLEVKDLASADDAAQAAVHIVYFPEEDMTRLRAQAAPLADKPVIRVAEHKRFARVGDVGFVLRGGRVQFFVNKDNTRRSGMKLGSQIMRLASGVE